MFKFNVYAFSLNSLYNERVIRADILVGKDLTFFAALELKNETQTHDIASWLEAVIPENGGFKS